MAWVRDSLARYSEGINFTGWFGSKLGSYFSDLGYGYQWWSATVQDHNVDFAWGHGGNLIVPVRDMHLIVVTAADPLYDAPESRIQTSHPAAPVEHSRPPTRRRSLCDRRSLALAHLAR